jgi:hypothetical protein
MTIGRHLEAVETVLATQTSETNAVLAENLRGLARAWDIVETTGDDLRIVAAISAAMVRILEKMRIDDTSDIWDTITEQLTQ